MAAAIQIENLSKKYMLSSGGGAAYRTLREEIMHAVVRPVRWLRGGTVRAREEFWALRDVSFDVQPGEVMGIIGRNGAGKSTLLKILSRITRPTAGNVELKGRVGSLLEVGTGFHAELSGRENIFLSGAILGMKRAEIARRFDEIVDFAGIEQFLDTPVKRYSSGMYVRLGFSIAAHLTTEILIIDEVLAVGDIAFQRKCLGKVESLAAHGRTVLYVSHHLSSVSSLCSRAVWLEEGGIAQVGPASAVTRAFRSAMAEPGASEASFPSDETLAVQIDRAWTSPAGEGDYPALDLGFEYTVREAGNGAMFCIDIRNADGVNVYYANDSTLAHESKRCIGKHRCMLRVPVHLFAPSRYEIQFALWEPGRVAMHVPKTRLQFERPDVETRLSMHGIAWPSVLFHPPEWRVL